MLVEKEVLAARALRSTALPYSLNTALVQDTTFTKLQRAVAALPPPPGQKRGGKETKKYLKLPKCLPVVNPYSWPPSALYSKQISDYSRPADTNVSVGNFVLSLNAYKYVTIQARTSQSTVQLLTRFFLTRGFYAYSIFLSAIRS